MHLSFHDLQLLAIAGATAVAITALGLAPARLLLGARAGWWAAAPALGYALFAVLASWLSLWLPMKLAVWPLLLLAVASAGVVLVRLPRGVPLTIVLPRAALWPAALTVAALFFALAPAFGRPELLTIGPNWDFEVYLPLASALASHPNGFSLEYPAGLPFPGLPNPHLWRINHFDPRSGGLGFMLLHAGVGGASGLPAQLTYIPALAALFALAAPGYWFLLHSFQPSPAPSLPDTSAPPVRRWKQGGLIPIVGTLLLTFHAGAAFVLFMGFGQQIAAAVLLAALAALALRGLATGDRGALTAAALLLAGLLVTYSPVLPLAAMLLAGATAGAAVQHRSRWPLVRGAALIAASAVLVPFAVVRLAVRASYALQEGGVSGLTPGPGVERFPPLAWGLGLLPDSGVAQGWSTPLSLPWMHLAVSIALVVVVGLAGIAGLWHAIRLKQWALIGGVGLAAALVLTLRLALPYPYGYFKLLPSAAPFLLLLPALGIATLASADQALANVRGLASTVTPINSPSSPRIGGRRSPKATRRRHGDSPPESGEGWGMMRADYLALTLGFAITAISVINGFVTAQSARASSPHTYGIAAELVSLVPAGSRVCIEGGRGLEGPAAGAAAYFLRHADLYGGLRTGYSTFFRLPPNGPATDLCSWFLLPSNTPPPPVLSLPQLAWEGSGWRLYQRDPAVLAALDVRELVAPPRADHSAGPGVSARQPVAEWRSDGSPAIESWTPPLLGVLAPTGAAHWRSPLLARSVTLTVLGDALSVRYREPERADTVPMYQGRRTLEVVVSTTRGSANVHMSIRPSDEVTVLSPGVAVIVIGGVGDTARVELGERTGAVRVMAAYLVDHEAEGVAVTPVPDILPLTADGSMADGGNALLSLDGPLAEREAVLDIYREDGGIHYGYWRLGKGQLPDSLTLDLAAQRLTSPSGGNFVHEVFPISDGRYRAYLARYRNGKPERMLPLFSFRLHDGHASEFVMETRGDHLW